MGYHAPCVLPNVFKMQGRVWGMVFRTGCMCIQRIGTRYLPCVVDRFPHVRHATRNASTEYLIDRLEAFARHASQSAERKTGSRSPGGDISPHLSLGGPVLGSSQRGLTSATPPRSVPEHHREGATSVKALVDTMAIFPTYYQPARRVALRPGPSCQPVPARIENRKLRPPLSNSTSSKRQLSFSCARAIRRRGFA